MHLRTVPEAPVQNLAGGAPCAWRDPAWSRSGYGARLVDTTMLFAPKSGGVKRYLLAKRAWFSEHRKGVRHTLVVPGSETGPLETGVVTVAAMRMPFGDGYRCPASPKRWADHLTALRPDVIEAGDPYGPGAAALEARERLGVPVVAFCHSDPAALTALHIGSWAEPTVRRRWARLIRRFDRVIAPSRHIAERLDDLGVFGVVVQPLGVDVDTFHPDRADPGGLRAELGLSASTRLLVFAGRAAREKNIDVILDAAARLGPDYHLILVGAGAGARPQDNASFLDFRRDPREVARLLASCDAFVHANHQEPFGLVVLEALACGLPVVGVEAGGVSELVDEQVGQLAPRPTAEDLAEAIEALFARDLGAISLAARARAVARHGWACTFERLAGLYADLSGVGAPATPLRLAGWR
ncbi:MAG TPA: glycosyltransferase [Caulobacteraceae bacterium]|nr:glycosyltransferase [Caulobacteraceae bacterium]